MQECVPQIRGNIYRFVQQFLKAIQLVKSVTKRKENVNLLCGNQFYDNM